MNLYGCPTLCGEHCAPAPTAACPQHGEPVEPEDAHAGFTGAPIFVTTFACGCQDVDASADSLESVR
jgi:hypothetical protein